MNKFFYIPVENQNRELFGKFFLACFAADRGYRVFFGHDSVIFKFLSQDRHSTGFPKGVLLYNGLSKSEYKHILNIIRNGFPCFIHWEEEASWNYYIKKNSIDNMFSDLTIPLATRFCLWGEVSKKTLAQLYPDSASLINLTGTHRMDPLRKTFRHVFSQEVQHIKETHGKYILFPSNLGALSRPAFESLFMTIRFHFPELATEEYFAQLWNEQQTRISQVRLILEAVTSAFPEHTVLIRPHPTETLDQWADFTRHLKKVRVVKEGIIAPWIMGSDAFFHFACNSSFEGVALGHPQVDFRPESGRELETFPSLVPSVAADANQLTELLGKAIEHGTTKDFPHDIKLMKDTIDNVGGAASCPRIVSALDQLDWEREVERAVAPPEVPNISTPRVSGEYLQAQWKYTGVSLEALATILKTFQNSLGIFQNIEVRQIVPELFSVSER